MTNGITKDESAAIGKFIEETSKLNIADVIKSVCEHEWYETENYYIKCKKCNKLREEAKPCVVGLMTTNRS